MYSNIRTKALSIIPTPNTVSSECIILFQDHSSRAVVRGSTTWREKCLGDPLQSLTSIAPPTLPTPKPPETHPDTDDMCIPPPHRSFKGHFPPPPHTMETERSLMTELLAPFSFWVGVSTLSTSFPFSIKFKHALNFCPYYFIPFLILYPIFIF